MRLTDGFTAAAPMLTEALRRYRAQPQELDWLSVSYNLVAMDLWDDEAWFSPGGRPGSAGVCERHAQLASVRARLYLAEYHIQAELIHGGGPAHGGREHRPGDQGGHAALRLAPAHSLAGDAPARGPADRGDGSGASARGEGAALTYAEYANAVLHNGLGNYWLAAEAAHQASAAGELIISHWALYELVEAAVRSDQREHAAERGLDRLVGDRRGERQRLGGGAAARSRALLAEGRARRRAVS